jgi:hypothetical protein
LLGYKSILHGTWIARDGDQGEELFFIWAERDAEAPMLSSDSISRPRIRRHPHAATTIEIADLLSDYVPDVDWGSAQRLTRVAYLPSSQAAPVAAGWLYREAVDLVDEPLCIEPWRIEGLSVPLAQLLTLLITLPLAHREIRTVNRLGNDLLYWGAVAKYALELLGREWLHALHLAAGDRWHRRHCSFRLFCPDHAAGLPRAFTGARCARRCSHSATSGGVAEFHEGAGRQRCPGVGL